MRNPAGCRWQRGTVCVFDVQLLSCHRVKLFTDGALGSETAALSAPYICKDENDTKVNTGILMHSQTELNAFFRTANEAGFRLEVHAIGDKVWFALWFFVIT